MILESGWGKPTKLRIFEDGSASTVAISHHILHESSHNGLAFALNVEATTFLNADGESGVLYFVNDGDKDIHIDQFFLSNDSTVRWRLYKNPSTGTLITGGTSFTPVNLNFQSGITLDATTLYGASGDTVTDGDLVSVGKKETGLNVFDEHSSIILGRNNSFALTVEPDGADAEIDVVCYVHRIIGDSH